MAKNGLTQPKLDGLIGSIAEVVISAIFGEEMGISHLVPSDNTMIGWMVLGYLYHKKRSQLMKRLLSLSFLFLLLVLLSRVGMNQTQLMAAQSEPASATALNAVGSQTQVSDSLHSGSVMENVAKLGRESGLHIPGSNYKKNALWSALAADEEYVEHIGGDTLADWFAFYDNQSREWDIPVDMIESSQGGFLLVGRTLNRGSAYPDALWVLKLADSGAVEWQRTYLDGRGRVEDGGVTEVQDGYVILSEESSLAGEILLKIDYDGSIVWQKNFLSSFRQSYASWSTIDKSPSGVIVGGRTASQGFALSGLPLLTEIDNDGTVIRSRTFDHRYQDGPFTEVRSEGDIRDVVVLEDGKVFVTGRVRFTGGEWRQYGFEAWYALLDQEWNVLWERTVGLPNLSSPQFDHLPRGDDSGQEVTVTSDGGFLISASHQDYWSENGTFWTGVYHAWLIKLSADGSIAWQKVYFGDESEDDFSSVLGDVVEVDDGYVGIGANQDGRWLIDFSATGEVEREQSYGSRSWNNYSSEARVIIPTSAGDYVSLNTLPRPSDPDEQDLDLAVARSSDGMLPSCVQLHSEFSPAEVHVGTLNPAAPLSSAGSVKFTTEDLESEDFDSEPTKSTPEFACDATNPDTYSISGRVNSNNGPAAISDVTVSAGGASATTDSNGDYTISGLANGQHTVTPSKEGYTFDPQSHPVSVEDDDVTGVDFVGTTTGETYVISGHITEDNDNGPAISGVTVSAGSASATTDSNGNYTISGLTNGQYTVTPSKEGYTFEPESHPVSVEDDDVTGVDFVGTGEDMPQPGDPPPTPEPGTPFVTKVEPCIGGPFYFKPWRGSPTNLYRATVDWQGLTPASVDFALNGRTYTIPTSSDITTHAFDLQELLVGEYNKIEVQAKALNGVVSDPYSLNAIGIDNPYWLPANEMKWKIPADCKGNPMEAKWEVTFPNPALEGYVIPPNRLTIVGDKPLGLKPTQAGVDIEFAGDGEGSVKVFGQTGWLIAGDKIDGKLYGKGEGSIDEKLGMQVDEASLGVEIEGTITVEKKIVELICKAVTSGACPLKEAESTPVIGEVVKWFNEAAKFQAKFKPAIDLALHIYSQPNGWKWKGVTGGGKLDLTIALILDAMKDKLSAEGYGGGEVKSTFQVPPDPSYLKKIEAELLGGVKLKALDFERTIETSYKWTYEPSLRMLDELETAYTLSDATEWQPIPRTYTTDGTNYALFRANEQPLRLGMSLAAPRFIPTDEQIIASNVFPDGHPVIAADDSILMLWVHDDVNRSLMQGKEIYYTVYNGTTWSTPDGITNDNLQDLAPQIAFDSNGNAVAVWGRNKTVQSDATKFDADYTNAFELAYAVWNGTSWSVPTYLTDNDALDHAPILVQGNDGNLLLVWYQNEAGELLGTANTPDTIYYSTWNGTEWTSPQVLLDNIGGILSITAARHNANTMSLVYARDMDDDLATTDDEELVALNWDGNNWSAPSQLTDDNQPDNSPTLFYDNNGFPSLLWLKGETFYALLEDLSGTPQVVAIEDSSSTILDYAATQDAEGNLVLLWQGYSDEGVDVFYATYDSEHELFGLVQQLTHDEPLEKFMAPAFAPTGELVMAYNQTALVTETVTVSSTLVIDNVTKFGQTDLYVLTHTFGPDVTIPNITVVPNNPEPGSTAEVNITLHNYGDRAIANPEVALYFGDPNANGDLLTTTTADLVLAGGMTTTQSIAWNVPTGDGSLALYAVADPNNSVAELDETNNTANLLVAVPDLVVNNVHVGYGNTEMITLTATISNTGVGATTPFNVDFRLNDPITGTVVATGNGTSIAAGAQTDIQVIWDSSDVPTGRYKVYAVADPDGTVPETDETNNDEWAGVSILPDLELRSTAVITGTNPDGSQAVSIWVFNTGSRDAENVTLGLYDRVPTSDVTPLVSETISVPVGGYPVTTLNLVDYSESGFYIGAGIGDGVLDRNISNNVLLIGQPPESFALYLPTVLR